MTMPTMEPIRAAAEATGLSYDFIRKLIYENKIVYVRAGKKFYVNMEKLREYLEKGEQYESAEIGA